MADDELAALRSSGRVTSSRFSFPVAADKAIASGEAGKADKHKEGSVRSLSAMKPEVDAGVSGMSTEATVALIVGGGAEADRAVAYAAIHGAVIAMAAHGCWVAQSFTLSKKG
jgi:hypothetical protein